MRGAAACSRCQSSRAVSMPTARATDSVPGRRLACWKPPKSRGRALCRGGRRIARCRAGRGICGRRRSSSLRRGRGSRRGVCRRLGWRRCGAGMFCALQIAASSATGWRTPVSLWARMAVTRRVSGWRRAGRAVHRRRPLASTPRWSVCIPSVAGQFVGTTPCTLGCSNLEVTTCGELPLHSGEGWGEGEGVSRTPRPALMLKERGARDGEVVRFGAAAGEDHLKGRRGGRIAIFGEPPT